MIVYNALSRRMKNGRLVTLPAPVDKDTPEALWEAERVVHRVPHLAAYGCDAWLWPPLTMAQGRTADNADGYGRQFDLNFGQWPNRPIRWGSATQIEAANRVIHEHGMLALEDAVIHQYDGGTKVNGFGPYYFEIGRNGKVDINLFPKYPKCFVPQVLEDDVFDPEGNNSFGDMVSYTHDVPQGYMLICVIRAIQARKERLGLDGGRLDDTKGETTYVSEHIIEKVGGWWFGECFVGRVDELEDWVRRTRGKRTLDFPVHWMLKAVCESGASLRILVGCGLAGIDAAHSVLFVDSADTDNNDGENIRFKKRWAYFYILTIPAAAALIYSRDYEEYRLGSDIDKYMWVHTVLAIGAITWEFEDNTLLVWSRNGDGGTTWSGGVLCGFSSDANWRHEWVHTPFGPNRKLHDYVGTIGDVWTNKDGWVHISAPPDTDGSARNCFALAPCNSDGTHLQYKIPIVPRPHNTTGSMFDFRDKFPNAT